MAAVDSSGGETKELAAESSMVVTGSPKTGCGQIIIGEDLCGLSSLLCSFGAKLPRHIAERFRLLRLGDAGKPMLTE